MNKTTDHLISNIVTDGNQLTNTEKNINEKSDWQLGLAVSNGVIDIFEWRIVCYRCFHQADHDIQWNTIVIDGLL